MAQCLLLRHVRADTAHLFWVDAMHQPLAVGVRTFDGRLAQGQVQRVSGDQRVMLARKVDVHARPAMRFGDLQQKGTEGIKRA